MNVQELTIRCQGITLVATLHLPGVPHPPCVIASHGLHSSKDSPKMIAVGEHFAARGMAVLRYDHRGCGGSGGNLADTTVAGRLADLLAVMELVSGHPALGGNIGLLGSSMGGFVSVLHAARDPRIRALALWSTPLFISHPERDAEPGTASPETRLLEDVRIYDLRTVAAKLPPCLIVHGEADHLVPPFHATTLHALLPPPKELRILPGGDHKLSRTEDREKALHWSSDWFSAHLQRRGR